MAKVLYAVGGVVPTSIDELHFLLKQQEINAQIPVYTATDLSVDPVKEADVVRYSAAAADKLIELQGASDPGTVDSTLNVAEPQAADVGYSRLSLTIAYLDPWAGAPTSTSGWVATLKVEDGDGAEARVFVVDAPSDVTAVLPFTQDPADPSKWVCEARDGHKWSDHNLPVTLRLLWGNGSVTVSPDIICAKLHDRKATAVRYGVSSTRTSPGRGRP